MPAERIDDERLAELIAETRRTAENWKAFDTGQSSKNPEYESIVQGKCDDLLACLVDYQSRRQAERDAMVGAEKLAERISQILYPEIPGITDSDGVMFARENVRSAVEGILAPLYAKLARQAALLGECRDFIDAERSEAWKSGNVKKCASLIPLLTCIDAEVGGMGEE